VDCLINLIQHQAYGVSALNKNNSFKMTYLLDGLKQACLYKLTILIIAKKNLKSTYKFFSLIKMLEDCLSADAADQRRLFYQTMTGV
jgi:hypothetical protein